MKIFFFLSLTALLVSFGVQRTAEPQSWTKPCAEYALFVADKDTGMVKVYEAGPKGFSDTYQRLMREKYQINIIKTDLFGLHADMNCYNSFSIPYVEQLYGDTIFDHIKREANKLDAAGLGDRPAVLKDSSSYYIQEFIYQRVDPSLYSPYLQEDKSLKMYCHLYTDASGRITGIYQTMLKGEPIDTVLNSLVKEMPYTVIPALDNGENAPGLVQMFLFFGPSSMALYRDFNEK
jgi:hypothetical protein